MVKEQFKQKDIDRYEGSLLQEIDNLKRELLTAKKELAGYVHTFTECKTPTCLSIIRLSQSVRGMCNHCVEDLLHRLEWDI